MLLGPSQMLSTNALMQRIRSHLCNIILVVLLCQSTNPVEIVEPTEKIARPAAVSKKTRLLRILSGVAPVAFVIGNRLSLLNRK